MLNNHLYKFHKWAENGQTMLDCQRVCQELQFFRETGDKPGDFGEPILGQTPMQRKVQKDKIAHVA